MNAAGIDVSSRKSTVAVLRPFGEVVKLPFDVRHSAEDLAALAAQLKSIDGETRVVMEHTGRYYESIAKVLHEAGLYVSAVNPLLIKEYGNNSLRKVKTDKADAMKIAKYALDNWTELRDYTPIQRPGGRRDNAPPVPHSPACASCPYKGQLPCVGYCLKQVQEKKASEPER